MGTCIDRFINFHNLSRFINDNSRSLDAAIWGIRRAVQKREIASSVHQKREIQLIFFRKFLTRICVIVGDPENLGIVFCETTRLITERANLRRSAASEVARVKR